MGIITLGERVTEAMAFAIYSAQVSDRKLNAEACLKLMTETERGPYLRQARAAYIAHDDILERDKYISYERGE